MGAAMASHVHDHLQANKGVLHVYNRSPDKCAPLAQRGAKVANTPQELAEKTTIIIASLANDQAVEDVFNAVLPVFAQKADIAPPIFVDTSTVLPGTTKKLAAKAQERGVIYFSSPVFGRPEAAAAKLLVSIPSGPKEFVERARPYLGAYSRAVVDLGDVTGASNAMKLSGNFMIASIIDLLGQAMTLGEKNGVSREKFYEVLQLLLPAPIILGYAKRLATDDLECPPGGGFTSQLALKDVSHMRTLGQLSETPLPFADIVFQHLLTLRATGNGELDWTATGAVNRTAAGLELQPNKKQ
jgi:3-hydroxyisobutyrate dehydrogenase-like beta-hydroxyacid dehydrogenase